MEKLNDEYFEVYVKFLNQILQAATFEEVIQLLDKNTELVDPFFVEMLAFEAEKNINPHTRGNAKTLKSFVETRVVIEASIRWCRMQDVETKYLIADIWLKYLTDKRGYTIWETLDKVNYRIILKKSIEHLFACTSQKSRDEWCQHAYSFLSDIDSLEYAPKQIDRKRHSTQSEAFIAWGLVFVDAGTVGSIHAALQCYSSASQGYEQFSNEWIRCQSNIAILYLNPLLVNEENLEKGIALLEGIKNFIPIDDEADWWEIWWHLGDAYAFRTSFGGSVDENVRKSILQYEKIIDIPEVVDNPQLRSEISRALGSAYISLNTREKLQVGIDLLEKVLEMEPCLDDAEYLEDVHRKLAQAYYSKDKMGDMEKINRAIYHLEKVLQVATDARRSISEYDLLNLGNCYYDYADKDRRLSDKYLGVYQKYLEISNDPSANVHRALAQYRVGSWYVFNAWQDSSTYDTSIELLNKSFNFFFDKRSCLEWYKINGLLGRVYWLRSKKLSRQDIETAITHLINATTEDSHYYIPDNLRAEFLFELAAAYSELYSARRSGDYEKAKVAYEESMELYLKEGDLRNTANCANTLGIWYSKRAMGIKAFNHREAIILFHKAYEIILNTLNDDLLINIENNLGLAYLEIPSGNPTEDQEKALLYFESALSKLKGENYSEEMWCLIQSNLGMLYSVRITGDKDQNLAQAITACQIAEKGITLEGDKIGYSLVQQHLGVCYMRLDMGDRYNHLMEAVRYTSNALVVRSQSVFPYEWGESHNNIGYCYIQLSKLVDISNTEKRRFLELASEHLMTAFTVRSRDEYPTEWATTSLNIATISALKHSLDGNDEERNESTIQLYKEILEVLLPELYPVKHFDVTLSYGSFLYIIGSYYTAIEELRPICELAEEWRVNTYGELSKDSLAVKTYDAFNTIIDCFLKVEMIDDAFEYVCKVKNRRITESISGTLVIDRAELNSDANLEYNKLTQLWKEIEALQVRRQLNIQEFSKSQGAIMEKTKVIDQQLHEEVDKLYQLYKLEKNRFASKFPAMAANRNLVQLTSNDAVNLATSLGATIMEIYFNDESCSAFVISENGLQYQQLPKVQIEFLFSLFEFSQTLGQSPSEYVDDVSDRKILIDLYESVFLPVKSLLDPGKPLIIAPSFSLHSCPLSLALDPLTQQYIFEEFELYIVPSIAVANVLSLQRSDDDPKIDDQAKVLLVCHSGGADYLPFAQEEKVKIRKFFSRSVLIEENEAVQETIVDRTNKEDYDILHFICHGKFDELKPEMSGLYLNDVLTVETISTKIRLPFRSLVVMSSCETGISKWSTIDEMRGLNDAWLQAGASGVIGSLWTIHDLSTSKLFDFFYQVMLTSVISPPLALRAAMQFVKDDYDFKSHHYWGGFQYVGIPALAENKEPH